MKRTVRGYPHYRVIWNGPGPRGRISRPGLMNWVLEVAKRMRRRGHNVLVVRFD